MRTRIMNQLQALAMNEDRRWKSKLWGQQGADGSSRRGKFSQKALYPQAHRQARLWRPQTCL
jgi:hypothetical protein